MTIGDDGIASLKMGKTPFVKKVPATRGGAEVKRLIQERDELSKVIESCHKMLDLVDDEEEGTTSLTPLDERLRDYLSLGDVITDDMVNGDD